ncbi:hypothetical protein BC938DRAFT_474347 [Jimgerdemannia flammicorona]|uniref:Uncharacterized protein n=1 Tax=Jimgerdemannia flammicorona TaxID=994334 RepID=A0A433Q2F8_9FUNG|nr:hypothetical protein BC938DRAFT_474347 [Jimgerdemannia flammicorona]
MIDQQRYRPKLNNWYNSYFASTVGTQAQCNAFVTAVTKAIKKADPSRLVSISNISIDDAYHPAAFNNKEYVGTSVDFYDIYIYNDDGSLPTASTLGLGKTVVLSEFGEKTPSGQAHQSTVVQAFLQNARSKG